ncbi:hypothetical protein [Priestia aryabhattai]|uniref:hypothetical protein n=1 Tax=Priestia aryabhattai TaxID=412384 RepID=UPI002E2272B2|nr:hypothetical protein [Priestia aryabhattai]
MIQKFMKSLGMTTQSGTFCSTVCEDKFFSSCSGILKPTPVKYEVCRDGSKKKIGCCKSSF